MTVIIVTQRCSTIKNADLILVLDDGRLVGKGPHDELFESCETYREICLSQLNEEEAKDENSAKQSSSVKRYSKNKAVFVLSDFSSCECNHQRFAHALYSGSHR